MRKLIMAVASIALGLVAFAVDPMGSQTKLELGKWCSDFNTAKAYAEANNVPMLVFWANPGCGYCSRLEDACLQTDFIGWQNDRKIVMVFGYGTDDSGSKAAYNWIRGVEKLKSYPFVGVYWKSNAAGKKVESVFVGRSGSMPSKSGSLQQQLMDSVDGLIAGWTPGSSDPVVDPDPVGPTPPPKDDPDPTLQTIFKKSQSFEALVTSKTSDAFVGTAKITLGKISKTKGTVKISVRISPFSGSATTASATVKPNADGSFSGTLAYKKTYGSLEYALAYDAASKTFEFSAENEDYEISVGEYTLGGAFESDELSFYADFTDDVELPEGYDFEVDPPAGEPIHVKNGTKFSCDKATSIKVKKEDGDYFVEHDYGKNDDKTNESGLKISYKSSKGTFSGSFKIYASMDDGEKKPTLKSYTAKFSGVVIDQAGSGSFSVKIGKKTYTGTCSFE